MADHMQETTAGEWIRCEWCPAAATVGIKGNYGPTADPAIHRTWDLCLRIAHGAGT